MFENSLEFYCVSSEKNTPSAISDEYKTKAVFLNRFSRMRKFEK